MEDEAVPPMSIARMAPIWDLEALDSTLWSAVLSRCPSVDDVSKVLRDHVEYPSTYQPFRRPPFVRLAGHGRSFYRVLRDESGSDGPQDSHGCLAMKGSEVGAADYRTWMERLRRQRQYWGLIGGDELLTVRPPLDTMLNNLERWPVVERKFPGAMTADEALSEATVTYRFQRSYFARFGELARVPLPLLVLAWPEDRRAHALEVLQPLLSQRAVRILEQISRSGLAVYVYFYPSLPSRLMTLSNGKGSHRLHQIPNVSARFTYRERRRRIDGVMDVDVICDRWLTLFARMLVLGFLPKDPGSLLTADCLQPWNVVLDGGFVDTDSLVSVDDLDPADVADTLRRSVRGMATNLSFLLVGMPALQPEFRDRFPDLIAAVFRDVGDRMCREEVGGTAPAIVKEFFSSADLLGRLDRIFRGAESADC